ncbi:hypothetical protein MPER_12284 [Moniliophthora perniciosa FA553]|nr:hypothetical protein MPER_12284 [Moniliophthora perniciosa FA553]
MNGMTAADTSTEVGDGDADGDNDDRTYCLCNRVSFGEMIGCDNADCEIEWYHLSCVGLEVVPDGNWVCERCRGKQNKGPKRSGRGGRRKTGGNRGGRGTAGA